MHIYIYIRIHIIHFLKLQYLTKNNFIQFEFSCISVIFISFCTEILHANIYIYTNILYTCSCIYMRVHVYICVCKCILIRIYMIYLLKLVVVNNNFVIGNEFSCNSVIFISFVLKTAQSFSGAMLFFASSVLTLSCILLYDFSIYLC